MKLTDVEEEVDDIIEKRYAQRKDTPLEWLIDYVIAQHPQPRGVSDFDFYELGARTMLDKCIRNVLRKYSDPGITGPNDPMFEEIARNFGRIQKQYIVHRYERRVLVPVENMTRAERFAKAQVYRALGAGCVKHAEELERFVSPFDTAGDD